VKMFKKIHSEKERALGCRIFYSSSINAVSKKRAFHYVAQVGLKLTILLPQFPVCWDSGTCHHSWIVTLSLWLISSHRDVTESTIRKRCAVVFLLDKNSLKVHIIVKCDKMAENGASGIYHLF
jgi:hypothetical protein